MADAKLIRELRDRTGAGFLDVKKALDATNNDIEKAIEWLQERGQAKAAKKAGAIAADGIVITKENDKKVVLFEFNSQTDFVASNEAFLEFADKVAKVLLENDFDDKTDVNALKDTEGKLISEITTDATAVIGEKISLRRAVSFSKEGQVVGHYTHVNKRVAAIVVTEGGNEEAARNVAMHVASMNPEFLDADSIPVENLEKMKKEISESETILSKPEKIRDRIAEGMLSKKLSELTLVDQEFVMDKMKVSKYLSNFGAKAKAMARYEVGEGIEVVVTNFAEEVAAQMKK